MTIEKIIIIILIILGFVAVLIPLFIDGMEIIGTILSLVLFVLVLPVLYYSRRKRA